MQIFKVSYKTIYNWLNRWLTSGMVGLYNQPGRGCKPKFNFQQKEKIKEWTKQEPRESIESPEGTRVSITLLPDEETAFWLQASQTSLDTIWDNTEDDVYAQLLQK